MPAISFASFFFSSMSVYLPIIILFAKGEQAKFENEHQKKLQEMIEKKARGEKIAVLVPRRLKPTESDQLLQVLEASLKKAA